MLVSTQMKNLFENSQQILRFLKDTKALELQPGNVTVAPLHPKGLGYAAARTGRSRASHRYSSA